MGESNVFLRNNKVHKDAVRLVEDNKKRTEFDDIADVERKKTKLSVRFADLIEEEKGYCIDTHNPFSVAHQCMHLLRIAGCRICDVANHVTKYK